MNDAVVGSKEPAVATGTLTGRFKVVYAALMLVMLMSALDQTIVSTALPTVVGELHGVSRSAWVTTAYIMAATVAMPITGRLGDIIGRKKLLIAGIVLFLIGSTIAAATPDMLFLIIGRAVQGLGGGSLMITAQAIVAEVVPASQRARYMAPIGVMFTAASVGGPMLGGWFTDTIGWRWCFWINLPIGALALLVGIAALEMPKARTRVSVDILGITAMTAAVACTVLLAQWAGTRYAWSHPLIVILLMAAAAAWTLLVVAQRRARQPILPLKVFANRSFILATIIGLIAAGIVMFAVTSYMPTYLQMVYGHSATASGLLMLPMVLGVTVTSLTSGRLISRTGRYKPYPVVGTALMGLTLLLMSQIDTATPLAVLCTYLFLFGGATGLLIQNLVVIAQSALPADEVGTATSSNNFFREIGATLGTAAVGAVFTSRLSRELKARLTEADLRAIGDVDSLTPTSLHSLPDGMRHAVIEAYQHSFTPILAYLLPLIAVAFVMAVLLPEAGSTALTSAPESPAPR